MLVNTIGTHERTYKLKNNKKKTSQNTINIIHKNDKSARNVKAY